MLEKCAPKAKKFKLIFRLAALTLGFALGAITLKEPQTPEGADGSFFIASNPSDRLIGDVLKKQIQEAKQALQIQIYAMADTSLIKLCNQKADTLPLTLYYDPHACQGLSAKLSAKIKTVPYTGRGLMHRKVCIIDHTLALIGSSNFTTSSLYWHYNLLGAIRSPTLCSFLETEKKGSCLFEYGSAFLLPDYRNQALNTLIKTIGCAQKSIHLAMFSLTHPKLIQALSEASQRAVKLYLYLDKLNFKNTSPPLAALLTRCEKVFTQTKPVLLHHKHCLIDDKLLIMGSANWSKAGFKKNEEILLIFDKLEKKHCEPVQKLFLKLQEELEEVSIAPLEQAI